MTEKDPQAVARFVERFALLLAEGGMARMPARVFACLMTTDSGRMTAAELGTALGVSPAAVSGAVRYLDQVGLVAKGREPGERRDHYMVSENSWMEAFTNRDKLLDNWTTALREGVETLGSGPAAERLDTSRRFFEFLQREIEAMLDRWRAQERRDRAG
ncbi:MULTISPECIES: GbsR/MarR family transcriptional regulator [Actinokineospora]|uniref:MarR family transcriptional regulator n=1 Tax=Actinokineospora fastidiosa TaxID=1816 RepID=A0A918L7R0_9PSEU|nr:MULTISPECIES: MarR family transcriptional regulator [Actinokineospora]UVS76516.1 MarR family protein [Actinokineospora sp. UTMC 2448]GGS17598.1 MarR family transcriptional regulator [Actinokineospora fastidiosa]